MSVTASPSHGGASTSADRGQALAPGTRLAEYELRAVVGIGGFGIVYRAYDHQLQRVVAIKEYFPGRLATRRSDGSVVPRVGGDAQRFAAGRQSFLNEARLLARFDHPALVKVHRFWEEQGTAYMVMPFYEGRTLEAARRSWSGPPTQAWLLALLEPLLGALATLHAARCLHRDVAPDNILLLDDGSPVLLDLGAAREVIGDEQELLTTILKPSFAPIEQYAQSAGLAQGPWTDLYALGAVVYHCVSGRPPTPSAVRAVRDDLRSLRALSAAFPEHFSVTYEEAFTRAIDWSLALKPEQRPASVAALQQALGLPVTAPSSNDVAPISEVGEAADDLIREAWATTIMQPMPDLVQSTTGEPLVPAPTQPARRPGGGRGRLSWRWTASALVFAIVATGLGWQAWTKDSSPDVAASGGGQSDAVAVPGALPALPVPTHAEFAPATVPAVDAASNREPPLTSRSVPPARTVTSRESAGTTAATEATAGGSAAPQTDAPGAITAGRASGDGAGPTLVAPREPGRAPVVDRSFRSPAAQAQLEQTRRP